MRVIACIDEAAEAALLRSLSHGFSVTRTLDSSAVKELLLTGASTRLVIDPAILSVGFLSEISPAIRATSSRAILWGDLSAENIPDIIVAGALPYSEILLRNRDDHGVLLRLHLLNREVLSVRAALNRSLSASFWQLPHTLTADVLQILLRANLHQRVAEMLSTMGMQRRTLERELERHAVCTVNDLRHLGRLIAAFEIIARRTLQIGRAAQAVGYPSGKDLCKQCVHYVGHVPSDFVTRVSTSAFAHRLAGALTRGT